ncbi:MAG: acyl-CoA-binding protein [Cyclobacteriaceae bacterium]
MDLNVEFNEAVNKVQQLTIRPANEDLLKLYGLFKQATEGDVKDAQPGGFDFKAMAKYVSWSSLKGKSAEDAMKDYIELVKSLVSKYS